MALQRLLSAGIGSVACRDVPDRLQAGSVYGFACHHPASRATRSLKNDTSPAGRQSAERGLARGARGSRRADSWQEPAGCVANGCGVCVDCAESMSRRRAAAGMVEIAQLSIRTQPVAVSEFSLS